MTDTGIATTLELSNFMHITSYVPDRSIVGSDRSIETVGTGDGSTALFYLDNAYVLDGTYTLYYGATATDALANELTETTDYTLDKDSGTITLTTAGKSTVSTASIFSAYAYNNQQVTDTELQNSLNMAAGELESRTNTKFLDGTLATPSYGQNLNEKHDGLGIHDKNYNTKKYPLPNVYTTVATATAIGDTTLQLVSTNGFPSTGVVSIDTEKFTYTGKTTTALTGVSTATAVHAVDAEVLPMCIEISTTGSGTEPTYEVLEKDVGYDIDLNTGRIHLLDSSTVVNGSDFSMPPRTVPNRFRASYLFGYDSIPEEIKRCTLMIASQDLMHSIVRKSTMSGFNEFQPRMINVDQEWIDKTINDYTSYYINNT